MVTASMKGGDIINTFNTLERCLRTLNIHLTKSDYNTLKEGDNEMIMLLIKQLCFDTSSDMLKEMLARNCSSSCNDKKIIITVFDVLRDRVKISPSISCDKFLVNGYIEYKILIVNSIAKYIISKKNNDMSIRSKHNSGSSSSSPSSSTGTGTGNVLSKATVHSIASSSSSTSSGFVPAIPTPTYDTLLKYNNDSINRQHNSNQSTHNITDRDKSVDEMMRAIESVDSQFVAFSHNSLATKYTSDVADISATGSASATANVTNNKNIRNSQYNKATTSAASTAANTGSDKHSTTTATINNNNNSSSNSSSSSEVEGIVEKKMKMIFHQFFDQHSKTMNEFRTSIDARMTLLENRIRIIELDRVLPVKLK